MIFGVSLVLLLGGFGIGVHASWHFLPPLAPDRVGVIASWVVRVLIGLALGFALLQLYHLVNDLAYVPVGESRAGVLIGNMLDLVQSSAPLLGFAAVTYLLAPVREDELVAPVNP